MACESRVRQMALVATSDGIPAASSRRGFYTALATGTLLGGLLIARRLGRRGKTPPKTASIPTLSGRPRLDPIPTDKISNQQCASCLASAQDKRGLWYAIRASTYCQDCAPAAAREGGFSLGVRSASMISDAIFNADDTPSVAVKLRPGRVRVGVAQVEGYTVLRARDRQETGLTITPAFKIDGNGQVQLNKKSWFVNYARVGQPVGGPFKSLGEAQGLASELARFDWNRAIEEFDESEINHIVSLVRQYREELDFREYMRKIK